MAVNSAESCSLPSSTEPWFWKFLSDELKLYPGRLAIMGRMVLAATLTMLIVMTMRSPNSAIGIFFSLTVSRENPINTIRHGLQTLFAVLLALIYVLVGVTVFINDSLGHFLFIAMSLALLFFVIRTFKNYNAALGFCFIVVSALPVWDLPFPVDAHVDANIWSVFGVVLSICVTITVELLFSPQQSEVTEIQQGLNYQLTTLHVLLQHYLAGKSIVSSEEIETLKQQARLGASRLRGFLAQWNPDDDSGLQSAEWGLLITVTERLVAIGANLAELQCPLTPYDQQRLSVLQSALDALQTAITKEQWPELSQWNFPLSESQALPLLPNLERKLALLPHLPEISIVQKQRFRLKTLHWRQLFVADAFENTDYLHFAVKGMLSGLACYVFFSSVDWHGLGNSLTTCVITALSTVGSSRQKQILRFTGAILGGLILGIGSQIYILPWIDTIFGFTLLFVAVTALAAWFTTASPRLSFLGIQMALAFYLIMFQNSGMEISLLISRDFVLGTLLGLILMWAIFDQLWAKPALIEMKEAFAHNLRSLGQLNALSRNQTIPAENMDRLQAQINTGFTQISRSADNIVFEFGKQRAEHLYWRSRFEEWQTIQESLFLAQLALLYHLQSKDWPESLQETFQQFNQSIVEAWQLLVEHLLTPCSPVSFSPKPLKLSFDNFQQEALRYAATQPSNTIMNELKSLLELNERLTSLTDKLIQEIFTAS